MTFKTLKITLITLNIILFCANCVKEVDYQSDVSDNIELVVSGRFTNIDEPHLLYLTRPGNYDRRVFEAVRGATITLSDDLGQTWTYAELNRPDTVHLYYLKQAAGVPGRSYTLKIRLADGTEYGTAAQKMPEVVPMDSFTMKGEPYKFVRSNGIVVEEKYATVNVTTTIPAANKDKYLHWDVFSTHLFYEIEKIYIPIPPPQKQCFFTNYFNTQNIVQRNLGDLQPGGKITLKIGQKKIDNSFEFRICFSTYQLSTTKEAYDYWEKIGLLLGQSGTIFDAPPAPVYGNVYRNGDRQQATLGFFEVCSADLKRTFLNNGALGFDYLYFPAYCDYDWGKWPPVNHPECDDCSILPNYSLEVPWYW